MSWFSALLGRVRSAGVDLALGSGINFTDGLAARLNPVTGYIDVSATNEGLAEVAAVASATGWDPVGDSVSPTVVALAAGHTAGFYLVGSSVEVSGSEVGPSPELTATITWSNATASGSVTGAAITPGVGNFTVAAVPQLVYSNGSADIAVSWEATVTGTSLTGTVRATAMLVAQ